MEHEGDGNTYSNWCTWNNPQKIVKGTTRFWNKRISGDHPDYNIINIDQNTEKSPEDLRKYLVTQIPVNNHQLTLVQKYLKGVKQLNYRDIFSF